MANREEETPFVVHGSFRKHFTQIRSAVETLNATGKARALAPHNCQVVGEVNGFTLLAGEQDEDPLQVEARYLQSVLSLRALGGFSLWVNPGGYLGSSASYEFGVADSCGVRTFFTEEPKDVPFYVDPESICTVQDLAQQLSSENGLRPESTNLSEIGNMWRRMPFSPVSVAVGGIVRHRKRLLLVEDGRWGNQLTIPGTTVRTRETREAAMNRAIKSKFGLAVRHVTPFKTTFMIKGSGFLKPVNDVVFDDKIVDLSSETMLPQSGIVEHWVSLGQARSLAEAGEVEPNAAAVLNDYFAQAGS